MTPIKMPHNNRKFISPNNWDEGKYGSCSELWVTESEGILYSYWKPNFKQRIMILFGKPIRLCICGNIQPPVGLDCDS